MQLNLKKTTQTIEREPTYLDDARKKELEQIFTNSKNYHHKLYEGRPDLDEQLLGKKNFEEKAKNKNSVSHYHIVSNLSSEQHAQVVSYNGIN